MRKKEGQEDIRRRHLHEILDLVMDINGMQASKRELTGNHPTAFFTMNGHVGTVGVEVYRSGWTYYGGVLDVKMSGPFHGGSAGYQEQSLGEIIKALKEEKGRYQK